MRNESETGSGQESILARMKEAEFHYQLTRFLASYASCLDDGEISRWPSFFTENARYRVMSRENHAAGLPHAAIYCDSLDMIKDRACAVEKSLFHERRQQRRFLSGTQWVLKGADLTVRTNFLLVEAYSGQPPKMVMSGVYDDVLVEDRGSFLLSDRTCIYDNYAIDRSIIFPI